MKRFINIEQKRPNNGKCSLAIKKKIPQKILIPCHTWEPPTRSKSFPTPDSVIHSFTQPHTWRISTILRTTLSSRCTE